MTKKLERHNGTEADEAIKNDKTVIKKTDKHGQFLPTADGKMSDQNGEFSISEVTRLSQDLQFGSVKANIDEQNENRKILPENFETVITPDGSLEQHQKVRQTTVAKNDSSQDLESKHHSPQQQGMFKNSYVNSENAARDIVPGSVLKDRFELLEVIGRGGMGTVFKALDRRDIEAGQSSFLAIKVLNNEYKTDPDVLKALHSEARKTQQLAHPNIVTVYDFDRDGDSVFMTMEFMEGVSLDKVIKTNPHGLKVHEAHIIIDQMGTALAYAHSQLVIHSDFKPANVFIDRNERVKVLDFGIARLADIARLSGFDAGILGGLTAAYASLEMLQGEPPDPRDDIYALACVVYELLTGKHPYNRESAKQAKNKNLRPERKNPLIKNNGKHWKKL